LIAGIASVVASASVVRPAKRVKICRDPSDDMIVNCCLAAGADYLVSGDRDLLEIPEAALPFRIVTPAAFLKG
jgi:putative PIN family toxin of toxin-antitoxin system